MAADGGFGGGGAGDGCWGGGGGGGYSGGDGGRVAGGGGSYNAGANQVATAGAGTGNGSLTIELLTPTAVLAVTPATDHTATGPYGGPFTPAPASYTVQNTGSGTLTWSVSGPSWLTFSPASGNLAGGASQSVTVSVNASANTIVPGTQSGSVSFTSNGGSAARTATLTVTAPDMRADAPGLGPATAGVAYTGSFTCTNITTGTAPNATCTIAGLPPGLTPSCSPTSPAAIAGGSSFICSVSGTPTAGGSYSVTVTTGADFDTNTANDTAAATIAVTAPDLSIDLSGLPATAHAGQPYSGSFTCINLTAAPAPNATCAVSGLPAGLTVDACSPVALLVGNSSITCTVSGAPTASGTFPLSGSTGSDYDGNTGNNTAAASLEVIAPDMDIALSGLPATATVGVPYSGSFTCTNLTAAPAPNATCSVSGLPAGLTVDACSPVALLVGNSFISCSVTGTPAAGGTFSLSGATGSDYDVNASNDTESLSLSVSKGASTTTITSDAPDPSAVGETYTVTVTVAGAPGAGTPSGTVTITDGATSCTPALSAGTASCSFTQAAPGTPTLTATYGGDTNFNGNSDTEAHTVNKGNTATAISTVTPEPSTHGEDYTVSVTVTAAAPASGTPTGTVTISDGTNSCTTPALSAGAAACLMAGGAPAGSVTLTATYAGDANFNGSTGTASHGIDIGATTTAITADAPDPSVFGAPYTVSVQVAPSGAASGTPSGTVTISDGTNNCTTPAISGAGTAACTIAGGAPVGTATLTANYAGDSNFAPSSGTASHAVDLGSTTTAITTQTPNPSVFGAAYTVAVQVTPAGGSAGTPTGTVTISDGTSSCTTPAISTAGTASCAVPGGAPPGTVTLTAAYAGDASFSPSSGTASHTVTQGSTTTAITADTPDPSVFGAPYTVTVAVAPGGGAIGTPTGTVTISDGTNACTTPAISAGGSASCLIAGGAAPGTLTLTATYAGDANFTTSSGTTPHTVSQGATVTTITADAPDPSVFGAPYVVSVSVVPAAGAAGTPTGTVTISDGSNACTTAALSASGTASCTLSGTPVGAANLTATYAGDANFSGSADTEAHAVEQITTTTALTQSVNPTLQGQPVTFSATIAPANATGTITFRDGATVLGAVPVVSGKASLTIASLSAGAHSITAVFGGDTSHTGSASPVLTHTVTPNGTITLKVATSEGDGTFTFSSATPALTASLTTSGGSGQTSAASLNPGSYAVTIALPSGFGLTSVSCSDSDSAGSVNAKSAAIVLAPAEQVICTFASTNSRKKTVEVIGQFMTRRADLMLSTGPDTNRQIDRLTEANEAMGGGSSNGGTGDGGAGFASGQTLGFGQSLGTAALGGPNGPSPSRLGGANALANVSSASGPFMNRSGMNRSGMNQSGMNQSGVNQTGLGGAGRFPWEAFAQSGSSFGADMSERGGSEEYPPDRSGLSPLIVSGSNDGGTRLSFATSLAQARQFAEDTEKRRVDASLEAAGLTSAALPSVRKAYSPFDIWFEGHYTDFSDGRNARDADGHFGIVYAGADYVVTPWLLVGALVQYDSLHMSADASAFDIRGHGWMAGPYATLKLSEHLYMQSRAAWGSSTNTVKPFNSYADDFSSDRWLASSTLIGHWQWGAWEFRPAASLAYIEDQSASYTDGLGVTIPGVKVSLGQFKAGPEIAYRIELPDGTLLQPRLGLEAIWNFDASDNVANFGGTLAGSEEVRGKVEAGLKGTLPGGVSLEFSGAYDGIGSDSLSAYSGRATLRVPLN